MRLGRRALLKASLGATQLGLLHRLGLTGSKAFAQTATRPTRLVTLHMPGGWHAPWAFYPTLGNEMAAMPGPKTYNGEPTYFDRNALVNLDGTGASLDGTYAKLVIPKLWNEAALDAGQPDPRNGTSPHGYAWKYHQLWSHASVVHGVDNMTAAHAAGPISSMCGVAASEWKSPAIHAFVASAFYDRFAETRPLPVVCISGPSPSNYVLRPEVAPMAVSSLDDISYRLSDRINGAWDGLRARSEKDQLLFDGSFAGRYASGSIEDRVNARVRRLKGLNVGTNGYLESLHNAYAGVSKVLAKDIVDVVSKTTGVMQTPRPHWIPAGSNHFATQLGGTVDGGEGWNGAFDFALRLMKADLASAIAINVPGLINYGFDNGHNEGHDPQFGQVRATLDVIGRFLGEMKATPVSPGRSLLDDTLVMLVSDFSRTWPKSNTCDHWPATTVGVIGGGITPNRMVGGYDVGSDVSRAGYMGLPVEVEENGQRVTRQIRSGDVLHTAMAAMGVTQFFIPGGTGEIVALRG
jgi:hypothetical protein